MTSCPCCAGEHRVYLFDLCDPCFHGLSMSHEHDCGRPEGARRPSVTTVSAAAGHALARVKALSEDDLVRAIAPDGDGMVRAAARRHAQKVLALLERTIRG